MAYYTAYEGDFCVKTGEQVFIAINRRSDVPILTKRIIFTGEDNSPIILSYKDQGDSKNTPINGCEVQLNLKAIDGFELADLYTADEKEWQVVLSGAYKFSGFIIPDSCAEPFESEPYDITISATDGLGTLKDIPFADDLLVNYKGWNSDRGWLAIALGKTGLQLPMRIAVNMFEDSMDKGIDPLSQAFTNAARFQDSAGAPFSCEEVIRSILARYAGSRIHQWDGHWQVVSSWEVSRGTAQYRTFAYGQNQASGSGELLNRMTAGGRNRSVRPTGMSELAKAYATSTAYYQYGYPSNQLINGSFDTWTTKPNGLPNGWQMYPAQNGSNYATGGVRQINGIDTTDYYIKIGGPGNGTLINNNQVQIRANQTAAINLNMFLNWSISTGILAGPLYFSIMIHDQFGNYFTNNGWQNYYGLYVIKYNASDLKGQVSPNFEIDPKSFDYLMTVGFLVVGKVDGTHYETWINDVSINANADSATKVPLGIFDKQSQLSAQSYSPDPILLLQGDETNEQRTSQILIGSATGEPSNAWENPGMPSQGLLRVVANANLRMHSRPYRIVNFEFKGTGKVDINTILTVDLMQGDFMFLSGKFDIKRGVHSLRFAQILNAEVIFSDLMREDYGTITNSDGVSVGSPGGITVPPGGSSGASLDGVIRNQDEYQTDARFNVKKGTFKETLIVPTVTPAGVAEGEAAFWVGSLSGVTSGGGGGGSDYVLPIASASVLGGVKIGSGINISADGTITAQQVDLSGYVPWSSVSQNANTPNTVVQRNGAGQIFATYFNTVAAVESNNGGVDRIYAGYGGDGYIRALNAQSVNTYLGINTGGFLTNNIAGSSQRVQVIEPPDRDAGRIIPNETPLQVRFDFCRSATTGTNGNYAGVMTFSPWVGTTASTGDASYQLAFGSNAPNGSGIPLLNIRKGIDSVWNNWYQIFHNGLNQHWVLRHDTTGLGFSEGTLELVNSNRNPVLGLHWQGVTASTITIETTGRVAIMNNPGTSYENFVANHIEGKGRITAGSGTNGGFENIGYNQGHNNIWRLNNAVEYGIGYYQQSPIDYIGFHFGNRATPQHQFDQFGVYSNSGRISVAFGGIAHDPYGVISVTRDAADQNYSYFGMTRSGRIGWGIGIAPSNYFIIGNGSAMGNGGIFGSVPFSLGPNGDGAFNGSVNAVNFIASNDVSAQHGYFTRQLVIPTVTPPGVPNGGAAIWIGNLSGITN